MSEDSQNIIDKRLKEIIKILNEIKFGLIIQEASAIKAIQQQRTATATSSVVLFVSLMITVLLTVSIFVLGNMPGVPSAVPALIALGLLGMTFWILHGLMGDMKKENKNEEELNPKLDRVIKETTEIINEHTTKSESEHNHNEGK